MKTLAIVLAAFSLVACGGGGGGSSSSTNSPSSTPLTVNGTAATGMAIPGAAVSAKCVVGSGSATTLADGSFALTIVSGQSPCVLEIVNPVDNSKLHTIVTGAGTATANLTPLTELTTARVLGGDPNAFFTTFDAAVATQKITSTAIQSAQTDIGLVLTGTLDTTALANFISTPLKAATQSSPSTGDAQDKLLDALKLKLTNSQISTLATALASNQTTDSMKQTVSSMTAAPVANAGTAKSVVVGAAVILDASASTTGAGTSLTYAWTLTSKPTGSAASLLGATSSKPTFTTDVIGNYIVSLVVNDGRTNSAPVTINITAAAANFAYVVNYFGNNVSAYRTDPTSGGLTAAGTYATKTNFSTNPLPESITISPSGKFAYVPNWSPNNIDIFSVDTITGSLNSIGTIVSDGNSPYAITFDPSGKFAYVANMNSNYGSIYSFDSVSGAFSSIGRYASGLFPSAVTFSPNGNFAYVTTDISGSQTLSAYTVNSATGSLSSVNSIAAGNASTGPKMAIDPSGSYLYMVNPTIGDASGPINGRVSAYAINPNTGALSTIGTVTTGISPDSILIAPSGKYLYVVYGGSNAANGITNSNVVAFSIDANGVLTNIGTYATGSQSTSIALDSTGKFVYVVNDGNISIFKVDATSGALTNIGTFAGSFTSSFIATTKR